MDKTYEEKTWNEFRETGLLVFVNGFLHIFGWAIAFSVNDEGNVINTFPIRTKFRGFSDDVTDKAYYKLTKYMKNTSEELLKDIEGDN